MMAKRPGKRMRQGGVAISGSIETIAGDLIGRDKVIYGLDEEKLVALLIRRGVVQSHAEFAAKIDAVVQLVKSGQDEKGGQALDIPLLALRNEITRLVGADPSSTHLQLAAEVERFSERYRISQSELAALQIVDARMRAKKEEAEALLRQSGDAKAARRAFDAAIAEGEERLNGPLFDLANMHYGAGIASFLDGDWHAGKTAWLKSAEILDLLSQELAALEVRRKLAELLRLSFTSGGDIDALMAALRVIEAVVLHPRFDDQDVSWCRSAWTELCDAYTTFARGLDALSIKTLDISITISRELMQAACDCVSTDDQAEFADKLASSLCVLAEKVGPPAGTTYLDEAIALLDQVPASDDDPEKASLRRALLATRGRVFKVAGEQASDPAKADAAFVAAAKAFQAALDHAIENGEPVSTLRSNLGIVLWARAMRLESVRAVPILRQAKEAHVAALQSLDPDKDRHRAAWISHNLAATLGELALLCPSLEAERHLDAADAAIGTAIEHFRTSKLLREFMGAAAAQAALIITRAFLTDRQPARAALTRRAVIPLGELSACLELADPAASGAYRMALDEGVLCLSFLNALGPRRDLGAIAEAEAKACAKAKADVVLQARLLRRLLSRMKADLALTAQ